MSSHGASPTDKVSSPLTEPDWWCFRNAETNTHVSVLEKTWMAARTEAALLIGCHVDELECVGSPFVETK